MGEISTISAGQSADLGERRQVSVLFADMVDYTAIVSELGEEKALDFVRMTYDLLTQSVEDHGGTVRDFAGDSIMALFGIPNALEDTALRSCRAALTIHERFSKAADDIEARFGVRPKMRIGISSGTVLVASVKGQDGPTTAVGNTVNLASRIESQSPPGGTLMCDLTRRLVEWVADLQFNGEYQLKGLAKPQKLWELRAIRDNSTRFDVSVAQGLSRYVGRFDELKEMSNALSQARDTLSVIDLVAEPGLGKTRLVFEFLRRVPSQDAATLTGNCFADGRQTPFLPFLEIVRTAFQIRPDDDPAKIERKITTALDRAKLGTDENLGLVMNLLGLEPPKGSLDGLDGVLIGLRTRHLLVALLKSKCARMKVILLIEDTHWIDSASEDILRSLVTDEQHKNLLIIQTRRPEYQPEWLGASSVKTLALKPLTSDDIAFLAASRLAVDDLPDDLAQTLAERASGNPLFGEEILSFLLDEGSVRVDQGKIVLDAELDDSGLPASMQGLLSSRLERLQADDRELLQAASVIGRRFDPGLLSQFIKPDADIGAALQRLQDLDVLYREANSSDYIFKHVLLRDSVYQSLVSSRRSGLHLAVAEILELRNANRLQEAAETLAFHYMQTDHTDRAFRYSAMAGAKSLGVYSLDEANAHFVTALDLYLSDPDCAEPQAFSAFIADFALCSNISLRVLKLIELADTIRPILNKVGDTQHHALFLHHYVSCLVCNGNYRKAHSVQQELTAMAERLGDPSSQAYAMVNELSVSIYFSPIANEAFQAKASEIETVLTAIDDAYIQNFFLATIGWNALTRGRVQEANANSDRMIASGKAQNDPRALGYGTAMKALIAMVTDDHELALKMAEEARKQSQVEFELAIAEAARVGSLVPTEQPGALETVERHIEMCESKGWALFAAGPETMLGVAYAMDGRLSEGLNQVKSAINRRDEEGTEVAADWARLFLCEMHLAVLTGEGGGSLRVLFRNLRSIIRILIFGEKELIAMIERIRQNPQFDSQGHYIARCDMIMGLLYKSKKKTSLALEYLGKARAIASAAGKSPMLTRIDTALAELA